MGLQKYGQSEGALFFTKLNLKIECIVNKGSRKNPQRKRQKFCLGLAKKIESSLNHQKESRSDYMRGWWA